MVANLTNVAISPEDMQVGKTLGSHEKQLRFTDERSAQKKVSKGDRLPAFTLHYLELMDRCMSNLAQNKDSNPFFQGTPGNHHSQVTRAGVFKEVSYPQMVNQRKTYMDRRTGRVTGFAHLMANDLTTTGTKHNKCGQSKTSNGDGVSGNLPL
jgi:hypothetical protein